MREPVSVVHLSLPRRLVELARVKAESEGKPLRHVVSELLDLYVHPSYSTKAGAHTKTLAYATGLLRRRFKTRS